MTTQQISLGAHSRLENFRPEDIKKLVQLNGRAKEGNFEFVLQTPPVTDAHLIAVVNDPDLEINPIGSQIKKGEMYFDLKANGRHVRVKIICHDLPSARK